MLNRLIVAPAVLVLADGTTVTVDWDAGTAKIDPLLKDSR